MKRISTATKSIDKFGAGKHGFTNGNAVAGIPATDLEDTWFDNVQEEMCAIIEAAGLALDGNNRAQLLAALRAAGVFQTAALGDRTTKPATTAFVQQELGGFSSYTGIVASRSLTATDIGQVLWFSAAGYTLTLPTPANLGATPGKAVTVFGNGYAGSVVAGGGASINFVSVNDGAMTIKSGQSVTFVAITTTTWQVINSTAAMAKNADFGASLAANGYQRLPSGLIIQWGEVAAAGGDFNANFPIAFPNACLQVVGNMIGSIGSSEALSLTMVGMSTTYFGARPRYISGGAVSIASTYGVRWIAIGW